MTETNQINGENKGIGYSTVEDMRIVLVGSRRATNIFFVASEVMGLASVGLLAFHQNKILGLGIAGASLASFLVSRNSHHEDEDLARRIREQVEEEKIKKRLYF